MKTENPKTETRDQDDRRDDSKYTDSDKNGTDDVYELNENTITTRNDSTDLGTINGNNKLMDTPRPDTTQKMTQINQPHHY